jgi:hypothetical protein
MDQGGAIWGRFMKKTEAGNLVLLFLYLTFMERNSGQKEEGIQWKKKKDRGDSYSPRFPHNLLTVFPSGAWSGAEAARSRNF